MMKVILAAIVLLIVSGSVESGLFAQSVMFVPGRLLFHPLVANPFEARMGMEKALDENFLTLEIGNSVDLLAWRGVGRDSTSELRVGADFFTWSHLLSSNDFRFPVQTVDYLFGLNAGWVSSSQADHRWEARLRLAHISAHLVDGSYDNYNHQWVQQEPFTYSREFVDVIGAFTRNIEGLRFRFYAGGTVLIHSIPAGFGVVAPHWGVEYHGDPSQSLVPFIAFDDRIQEVDKWIQSTSTHAGIKFGTWDATGTELYVAYESGESIHGMYYERTGSHLFAAMNISF